MGASQVEHFGPPYALELLQAQELSAFLFEELDIGYDSKV